MPHDVAASFTTPAMPAALPSTRRPVVDRPSRAGAALHEPLRRIAVRTSRSFVIVAVDSILRLAADDNYVVVWADRPYRHKATLDALCARLDPARFLRVHRSHAVHVAAVREVHALGRGEFRLVLRDGTPVRSGRRHAAIVVAAFGLAA